MAFLEYLTERGLTGSTKRRKMEAAKTFFQWLHRTGRIVENPLSDFDEMPKAEERTMRVLSEQEYRTLRDVVRSRWRKSAVRDYAIVELTLQTGLRISEVCHLRVEEVTFGTKTTVGHIAVRQSKGKRDRIITLNPVAEHAIKAYLKVRPRTDCSHLFLSNRGGSCRPQVLHGVFKNYLKKAGIQDASFHTLRHTFATHSLKKGSNILVIQEALGHRSLTTTQKYVHFIREKMDEDLTKHAL